VGLLSFSLNLGGFPPNLPSLSGLLLGGDAYGIILS